MPAPAIEIERPARKVTIRSLAMIECAPPLVILDVQCSAGTYIRTLAKTWVPRWVVAPT